MAADKTLIIFSHNGDQPHRHAKYIDTQLEHFVEVGIIDARIQCIALQFPQALIFVQRQWIVGIGHRRRLLQAKQDHSRLMSSSGVIAN